MEQQINFADDSELFTEEAKTKVVRLGEDLARQDQRVRDLETELEEAKAALRKIETESLVNAMDEAGMAKFTLKSGLEIQVKPIVEGSIPNRDKFPERNAQALQWLRENDHEGLIKRYLSVELDKGMDDIASDMRAAILEVMRTRGVALRIDDESSVHHSTLKSWAREMSEAGTAFPADLLGLWLGRKASLIKPKTKKENSTKAA